MVTKKMETVDESYRTDKFGNAVAERTGMVATELRWMTDAHKVIIHDAETGRIGYTSKRSVVNNVMLDVARDGGYRVDLMSAERAEIGGKVRNAVMIEFVPEAEEDL